MKVLLTLIALVLTGAPVFAQCDTDESCFFPPGAFAYLGAGSVAFGNGWQVTSDFVYSLDCLALPSSGGSVDVLDHTTSLMKLENLRNLYSAGGPTLMTMRVAGVPPGGNPREFDLELLALDVGGAFPAEMKLRESPTQASTGHMQQTEVTPGQFRVTSSFDVYLELSLDDGQSWSPATGPMHVTLTPWSSMPALPVTWGGLKATYR